MKTTTKLNLRKALLAGTAIVAVGAFSTGAIAASQEVDNADGAAAEAAYADADVITNTVDDATDFLHVELGANADDQITSIDSNFDGTIFFTDGENTGANDFDVSGFVDVASGTTLNFIFGNDTADSSGTDGLESIDLDIAGNLGEGDGTSRGGTLALLGANDITGDFDAAMTVDGSVMLTALSVTSGAGATDEGTSVTLTLGDAAADAIDILTLSATGGAGGVDLGGVTSVTVTGTLADATGGINVVGGAGGAAGAGGASKITVTEVVAALSGNTVITGGNSGTAAGAGGASELELTAGLTAGTGNFTVTGGNGATGTSTGVGGAATLDSDAAFTTTGTLTFAGGTAGASTGDSSGGAAAGEFAASLAAGGVTLTGGVGGAAGAGDGGAATATVATTSVIGSGGLTVTAGAGGADNSAAVGGAASFTSTGASTITGAIAVTGGNGAADDAADGGAASALFTAGVTATGQTLTITGGNGDAAAAGDGGAASVELNDASTFGAIVLDDGTDGTATGGEATLTVDLDGTATKTITGTITAGADGEGTLTIENTQGATNHVTFANNIGTSVVRLQALNIGNGNDGAHATFSGEVHADAIDIDGQDDVSAAIFSENVSVGATLLVDAGGASAASATFKKNLTGGAVTLEATGGSATATFDGSTAQTVTSTFVGGGANEGAIVVGNGVTASDVTFSGIMGTGAGLDLATLNVTAAAKGTFSANATFDGAWTNAGITEVGSGATLNAATLTDTAGSTIVSGVSNADGGTLVAADYGIFDVAGGGAIDTDDFSVNVTGLLGTLAAADILNTLTFDEAKQVTDNAALYTFTVALDGTVTAAQVSTDSITDNAGTKATADQLLSIGSNATNELLLVQNAFAAAGSDTVNDVLEAAASDVSGGAAAAGFSVSNQTSGINSQRLASLRDGSATGMSAGNGAQGMRAWGQVFGSAGDQDQRDGVSGYDIDTYGVAVGVDSENVADNMVVGLAFAYGDTEVDSDSIANTKTDIDSYTLSVYGDYDLDERTYLSGQLGYTWSDVDTTRNPGGLAALTANGDYDSSQINARVELGRDYQSGGMTLTPSVLANYVHYDADSYTETGAGTANLAVDSDSLNLFEIGVGVDASWKIENADGSFVKPVLSAGVRHDLIGDEFQSTNTFQNAGATSFNVKGFDPAQTTFDVGAGVTYFTNSGWDLTAEADYEIKSDFDALSGLVKASYNF